MEDYLTHVKNLSIQIAELTERSCIGSFELPLIRSSLRQQHAYAKNQHTREENRQGGQPQCSSSLFVLGHRLDLGRLSVQYVEVFEERVELLYISVHQGQNLGHLQDRIILAVHQMQVNVGPGPVDRAVLVLMDLVLVHVDYGVRHVTKDSIIEK